MERDFLINIAPITYTFKKVTLNVSDYVMMDECVKKLLKVNDLGQLRDRFEGDAFRNNFIIRTSAEIAFEKLTGYKFIDWNLKTLKKDYKPTLIIDGIELSIISSPYGTFPVVPKGISKDIIIALTKEPREVLFCGLTNLKQLKNCLIRDKSSVRNVYGTLTDFTILERFTSFDELINLLKNIEN